MFSQVSLSSGVSALAAIRWQWCALARYLSALAMALLLNFAERLREGTRASVMSVTERLAGSIELRGLTFDKLI